MQFPTTIGTFFIFFPTFIRSTIICGEVFSIQTISRSGITCAGLKRKCAPTIRYWTFVFALMGLRSIMDVLEAKMQCAGQIFSRSINISRFNGNFLSYNLYHHINILKFCIIYNSRAFKFLKSFTIVIYHWWNQPTNFPLAWRSFMDTSLLWRAVCNGVRQCRVQFRLLLKMY